MNLHHHTHPSFFTLHTLVLGAVFAACLWATPRAAQAQPQNAQSMLTMVEQAQASGQHQAALEILVSLTGQVPAAQLSGMLAQSELALQDYRMAELAAIAAMREASDPWVSQHRELLMETLAQAGRHLGEVVVQGLPRGLPVSTRDLNLGVTGQRLRLAEGPRVLTVTLPDGRRLLVTTHVVAGQTTSVDGSTASVIGSAAPTPPSAVRPSTALPTPFAAQAQPIYAAARPAAAPPTAPITAPAAYVPGGGQIHAAPTAGSQPLFQQRVAAPAAAVERATNRYGLGLDMGQGFGLNYASMQSKSVDSDGYTLDQFEDTTVVGGVHLFFQHDVGAHFTLRTHLGFASHGRHAASAWRLYGDPDFNTHVRFMDGHVNRFDLGQTARVVYGRRNAWLTSYIGLGGRVGLAVFRYHGTSVWQTHGGDYYTTPTSGAEVGYLAQGVFELGSYFGRKRTVEFGGSISVGKPLMSVSFHLGVSFNGW